MNLNEILDSMDKEAKANLEEAIGDERDERLLLYIQLIRKMAEGLKWYQSWFESSAPENIDGEILSSPARETLATVEKLLQEGDV